MRRYALYRVPILVSTVSFVNMCSRYSSSVTLIIVYLYTSNDGHLCGSGLCWTHLPSPERGLNSVVLVFPAGSTCTARRTPARPRSRSASTPRRRAARPPAAWSWTSCSRRPKTPRRTTVTTTSVPQPHSSSFMQDLW